MASSLIPPQKYRLSGSPQMEQIDEMFQDLFDALRASPIGGVAGTLGLTGLSKGDVLVCSTTTGTIAGLTAVTSGKVLRAAGASTVPAYSTFTIADTFASGALVYASSGNTLSALTVAAAGKVLRSTGAVPAYSSFTIPDTYTQGDMLYASGSNTLAALAKDTNATRYLSNTGASNNPAWAQVNLTNGVTGDLPFANLTQGSALSVLGVTGNATADVASIAAASDYQVLRRSGTAVAFGAIDLSQSAAVTGILSFANLPTTLDIRKTSDETVTDTTIQDDDELTVSLAATSAYAFTFTLFLTNGGAAEGVQFDLSGTVGVSSLKAQVSIYDDSLNTLAAFARVTALTSAVGIGLSAGDNYATIVGAIETTTAGTLTLRFAQNATGASAGVTVQEHSTLILRKLNA